MSIYNVSDTLTLLGGSRRTAGLHNRVYMIGENPGTTRVLWCRIEFPSHEIILLFAIIFLEHFFQFIVVNKTHAYNL